MRGFVLATLLATSTFAAEVLIDETHWHDLEANIRKAIVKIRVIGDIDGNRVTEIGTGFLVRTNDGVRAITAGHVIGADSRWDSISDRLIYVRQLALGSAIEADPVNEAKVEADVDVAQVYLDQYDATTLEIAKGSISASDNYDVGSWPMPDRAPRFQVAKLLSVRDRDRMHLSGRYEPSYSGSPVIDSEGRVAGMVVERVLSLDSPPTTIGLAVHAKSVDKALSAKPRPLKAQLPVRGQVDFAQINGCVFLGKKSAIAGTDSKDAPFGREILATLRDNEKWSYLVGKPVSVNMPADVRSRCPIVIDGTAYYGRVITSLVPGDSIVAKSILAMSYADDTFFWADVDRVIPASIRPDDRPELMALEQDPKNWAMPAANYANHRYSSLKQINVGNVDKLQVAWAFSTGVLRGHEGAPLVIGDVMYVHGPFPNPVYALDLNQDGKILWKYEPKQDPNVIPVMCCDTVNRGLSYGDGKIFLYQADTTLVALDAKRGKVVWESKNGNPAVAETGTSAPMVVKDKVIVGISGGEFGVRGSLTAYDIKSGKRMWRGYSMGPDTDTLIDGTNTTQLGKPVGPGSGINTWQGDQWKIGGGTTWGWYSFDPSLNLIYYGSGNPGTWNPKQRPGDNRWSASIWARDVDTGQAAWVYQMTPHDQWDYDGSNEMILADQRIGGQTRKTLVHFDRNGFGYTLDRTNGELLVAEKFDPTVNWASRIDMDKNSRTYGRPLVLDKYSTDHNGEDVNSIGICPAALGAKEIQPAAYSPDTGLFYVPTNHVCMNYEPFKVSYAAGQPYVGATLSVYPPPGETNMGNFIAWDGRTGKIVWVDREQLSVWSGALATAGGLVFYGTLEGYLKAVDAMSGKELYKFKTPSGIVGNVMTYEHGGRQYVAVLSGIGGWAGIGLAAGLTKPTEGLGAVGGYAALSNYTALGGVLTVFALPPRN